MLPIHGKSLKSLDARPAIRKRYTFATPSPIFQLTFKKISILFVCHLRPQKELHFSHSSDSNIIWVSVSFFLDASFSKFVKYLKNNF